MTGNDEVDESNDEVDKLKLHNDEVAWRKRKEQMFRRGSWLVH